MKMSHFQLRGIRLKGLECLVNILKCMVEWSKDLYVNPHAKAAAAAAAATAANAANAGASSMTAEDLSEESLAYSLTSARGDDPTQFEKVKQHKAVLEHGMNLFKQKPNKGIKYMQVG